ncbi:MAG: xanthine dehydrogenase family protein subunit M [Candidatus Eremiobacteraeota bacterium]|nr:xanthine dehydrogenase family protein subunit M [Candidatus Eremiobacteraeota bacterium]
MIPTKFEYARPASLDEAFALLSEHGPDAKLLAGGHSLIPMMKLRLAEPEMLIDLAGVPDLAGITVNGNRVRIGAMTRHAELAASEDLKRHAPVLYQAANALGDPQVRNRGTIGGALANGDPGCDYAAVMLALDATFIVAGKNGTREEPAAQFMIGMFETTLTPEEVLVAVSFDAAPKSAYTKYAHPASGYPLVGAAVTLTLNGDAIGEARIGITGVGDHAFRATPIEGKLSGVRPADASALATACKGCASSVDVRSEKAAGSDYRSAMADVYVARAIAAASAG